MQLFIIHYSLKTQTVMKLKMERVLDVSDPRSVKDQIKGLRPKFSDKELGKQLAMVDLLSHLNTAEVIANQLRLEDLGSQIAEFTESVYDYLEEDTQNEWAVISF